MKMKNVADIYPLSPVQQGMLFHTLYAPDSGAYFTQFVCTLDGDMDANAFKRAFERVIERHPILRTAFIWEGLDQPLQVVRQQVALPWMYDDWEGLPAQAQQERLDELLLSERTRGFDLTKAPLMRLTLLRWTKERHQLIWSSHHMLLDGWSLPLLLREIFTLYEAFYDQEDIDLPQPRPYRDYIAWLEQQDMSQAEAFWRQRLQGFTAPTPLPVVPRSDPADTDANAGQAQRRPTLPQAVSVTLPASTTAALQTLARQHHLTVNAILQGAWALLLSRYSGMEDVVFGATFAGRPAGLRDAETMVGLFINTLPVRLRAAPDSPLIPWLLGIQRQQAEIQQYEYSPLVKIHEWSEAPRDIPLFDSLLVFENAYRGDIPQPQGARLGLGAMRNIERTHYPLSVAAALIGSEMNLALHYDNNRFAEATITRMAAHLWQILTEIAANPARKLADISLLTEAERHQLLVEWNATRAEPACEECILQPFEAMARQTPGAPAVRCAQVHLTYGELNARANQLAHHLRARGVGPEVVVGVCMERSAGVIVALLGILKAGGVFMPLDPAYPQERLAFLLKDARVQVLLTQEQLRSQLPAHRAQVICLDADWEAVAREGDHNPPASPAADSPAYVIYTSGSTGTPKGVLISNGALAAHCRDIVRHYQLTAGDTVLQFASFAFDASLEQILPTLMVGARLALRGPDLWTPSEFGPRASALGVTVANLPTAYWHQVAQEWAKAGPQATYPPLRLVIAGSDVMLPQGVRDWSKTPLAAVRLLNAYGPTETTITATTFEVPMPADDLPWQTVPIGRPLPNRTAYILDRHGELVPIGLPGELHIGGAGLAQGYLGRPELTAESFIPDRFSRQAGARLYKTGDLARYLPDGNIEFLGRIDHQVKIRGIRIELGEIETALGSHREVRQAVVVAQGDPPSEKRLVAYIVPKGEKEPEAGELRAFLLERLPEYMAPSAFVMLQALPMTANGKVDRRALPEPGASNSLGETFVAPRNDLEEILVGIWEEVLGIHPIGVTHNLFELGGHSLLAMQLVSRIREKLQIDFPLPLLFDKPTIAGVAEAIVQRLIDQADKDTLSAALKELGL